jgi:DNA-binding MarR family transcriptional regulator
VTDQTAGRERVSEDLPPSANYVYDVLAQDGELTAAELSDQTSLPVSTVQDALARLKHADIVSSRPDPRDARRTLYDIRMNPN